MQTEDPPDFERIAAEGQDIYDASAAARHVPGFRVFDFDASAEPPQVTLRLSFIRSEHVRDLKAVLDGAVKVMESGGSMTELSIPGVLNDGTSEMMDRHRELREQASRGGYQPGTFLVALTQRDLEQLARGEVTVHAANCAERVRQAHGMVPMDQPREVLEPATPDDEPEGDIDESLRQVARAIAKSVRVLAEELKTFNVLLGRYLNR